MLAVPFCSVASQFIGNVWSLPPGTLHVTGLPETLLCRDMHAKAYLLRVLNSALCDSSRKVSHLYTFSALSPALRLNMKGNVLILKTDTPLEIHADPVEPETL